MTVPEAELKQTDAGLVPQGEGWFVLNARDASWIRSAERGQDTDFEGGQEWAQLGFRIQVLGPGQRGVYHGELGQEDFLVVSGECVLVIEGQVDATVNSKVMEISKPGTLTGTAVIDIAEIHGEFSGELTARTKLVVHGTGRVTGTVRYGKLVVAEGGMLMGELKQIDAAAPDVRAKESSDTRSPAQAQPAH